MTDASPTDTTTSPEAPTTDAAVETSFLGDASATPPVTQEAPPAAPEADPATPAADAEQPPVATPPEKYEFALEGMTVDPALAEAADPILRELGLSNEQANTLMPVAQKIMQQTQEGVMRQLSDASAAQSKAWLDELNADPELGGAKAAETQHIAARGLDALGFVKDHPFRKLLTETGLGNHPDMIRTFRAIGDVVGEDGTFARSGAGAPERPVWERMYPNDVK